MKRSLSLLTVVFLVVALGNSVKPAAAAGIGGITINVTCNSITASGVGTPPGPTGSPASILDLTTLSVVGSVNFVQTTPTTWTASGSFTANPGDILTIYILPLWTVLPCGGDGSRFNAGDGRIDGQAGDRIAVYCVTGKPSTIYAYGVDDDSHGMYLGTVTLTNLLKKGSITLSGPHGSVIFSAWGNNIFTAKWNGPFTEFSSGQFGKKFTCTF